MWDVFADGKKVGEFYYERTREIVRKAPNHRVLNVRTYGRVWKGNIAEDISFCATFNEARRYVVEKLSAPAIAARALKKVREAIG